jgi:hypothetical protein
MVLNQKPNRSCHTIIRYNLFFRLDQSVMLGLEEVVKSLAPGRGLILPHKLQLWCQVFSCWVQKSWWSLWHLEEVSSSLWHLEEVSSSLISYSSGARYSAVGFGRGGEVSGAWERSQPLSQASALVPHSLPGIQLLGLEKLVKSLAPGRGLILPHKLQLWCQVFSFWV